MSKIAVVTDSNSGITQAEGKELGINVIPMPFMIGESEFFEDINLSQDEFYEKLKGGENISTSQPNLTVVGDLWRELLKEYDEIIHIPMSSGLSGSCQSAYMLSQEDEFDGKVFVIDNQRISVTQRQSAIDARDLAAKGFSGQEIGISLRAVFILCLILFFILKRAEGSHRLQQPSELF